MLTVCTILLNERPYLEEWLAFHRAQGVSAFRIYVDRTRPELGNDGSWGLLMDNLNRYNITLIGWQEPGPQRQVAAFNDALRHIRTEWAAFIDVDEFLFNPDGLLTDWLSALPQDVSAVGVQQRIFGSAGRLTKPAMPVTAAYTLRATAQYPEHRWYKSIVRMRGARAFVNSHHAVCVSGGRRVLGDGAPSDNWHAGEATRIATTGLRLHHYMLKSREEWLAKKAKGALSDGAAPGFKRFTDEYAARDANCNAVRDETLRDAAALAVWVDAKGRAIA